MLSKFSFAALTRSLIGIACAFLLTYSAAQQSSTIIRGTVINSITREPVSRALVELPSISARLTDDQGGFELSVSSSLQFLGQLQTRKPGFTDCYTEISLEPHSPDLVLTVALVPEALIIGHVTLPSASQYDRVGVELYRRQVDNGRVHWASVQSTGTRSNGDFRFADLAPGVYRLFTEEVPDRDPLTFDPQGQHYGYPPVYFPNAQDFASAATIQLEAGQTFHADLSPVLQRYFPVKIPVTNMAANSYLEVSVSLQGHKGPGYSLGYTGEQSIEGVLPNGTYTIEARVQDTNPRTGIAMLTVRDAPALNTSMTLVAYGSIAVNISTELQAKLRSQYSASLTVGQFSRRQDADVSLRPSEEFESNLRSGLFSLRPPHKTNDKDLVIENVPPGRYWVDVRPMSSQLYPASVSSEGIDLLRNPLVIGLGGSAAPIDIVLRDDGASLEGAVEGLPRPSAPADVNGPTDSIALKARSRSQSFAYLLAIPLPDSSGLFAQSSSNSDGTFRMQGLAPGTYRILAFDHQQDHLDYRNPEAMRAFEDKGPIVRLAPNQTEHIHLTLIHTAD